MTRVPRVSFREWGIERCEARFRSHDEKIAVGVSERVRAMARGYRAVEATVRRER